MHGAYNVKLIFCVLVHEGRVFGNWFVAAWIRNTRAAVLSNCGTLFHSGFSECCSQNKLRLCPNNMTELTFLKETNCVCVCVSLAGCCNPFLCVLLQAVRPYETGELVLPV